MLTHLPTALELACALALSVVANALLLVVYLRARRRTRRSLGRAGDVIRRAIIEREVLTTKLAEAQQDLQIRKGGWAQ